MSRSLRIGAVLFALVAAGCGDDASGSGSDGGVTSDLAATSDLPGDLFSAGDGDAASATRRAIVEKLEALLAAEGYAVDEGSLGVFRSEDCAAASNCYFNNPISPYIFYRPPHRPGEVADPNGGAPFASWRMEEGEAIVLIGRTPPNVRYFGLRSYLYMRSGLDLFASLGDAQNQLTIATEGTPGGAAGDPFDKETVLITTADKNLDALVRKLVEQAGAPANIANTDIIPRSIVNMGLGANADSFMMLFRVAMFADAAAGDAYLDHLPAVLLRVHPTSPKAIDGFALPTLRPRGTGTNESQWTSSLDRLGAAIKAAHPTLQASDNRFGAENTVGWDCIAENRQCVGEVRDTLYEGGDERTLLTTDPSEFLVVYGVNHQRTGKATYSSLSLHDIDHRAGIFSVIDHELEGSASSLLPPGDPAANYLYAWTFARNCNGMPHCSQIADTWPGVPLDHRVQIIGRNYLEPSTRVGPDVNELVLPRIIHFRPQ